ncbi:hypothetical protein HDU99_009155, partial [Rhizoclosmatium hyalinum]
VSSNSVESQNFEAMNTVSTSSGYKTSSIAMLVESKSIKIKVITTTILTSGIHGALFFIIEHARIAVIEPTTK